MPEVCSNTRSQTPEQSPIGRKEPEEEQIGHVYLHNLKKLTKINSTEYMNGKWSNTKTQKKLIQKRGPLVYMAATKTTLA